MRFCIKCGIELKEDAIFCPKCGTKQEEDTQSETAVEKSDILLYLGLLCASVFPGVVEAVVMLMTKQAMAPVTVLIIEVLGLIAGLALLSLFLCALNGGSMTRVRLIMAGAAILWIYFIGDVLQRLLEALESFAFTNFIQMFWIYYIVFGVLIVIALATMTMILSRTVSRLLVGHPGKLMGQPKLFWRTLLLLGASLFLVPDMVMILFSGEFIPLPLSFVGTVTGWVVTVYIQAILLKLTLQGITKAAVSNGRVTDKEKSGRKLEKVMPMVAVGLVMAVFVFDIISSAFYTTLDAIESNVQSDINYGAYYMASGDIEMAMRMYDSAYAKTSAWLAFVEDDSNQLLQLKNKNPDDEQIEYLLALKHYSTMDLERAIFEKKDTSDWYHMLLDAYKAQESDEEKPIPLSETQEIIRKDLLNACIASQSLINTSITWKDVEGQEKKITKALNPYLEFIEQYGVYKILGEISYNGGINSGIMNQLLVYAEDNKNDLLSQYLAYSAGRGFLYDGAPHYQRTAEAAMRFRALYLEQLDKDSDMDALTIAIDMEVAGALMDLQDYANAVVYLEEAGALGAAGDIRRITAQCYESLENYEKSLEMASLAVLDDPKDYEALNLAMISALKVGNVTESMEYAVSLLDLMASLDGIEYLVVDADLYIYVQYMTVQDQTQWTPQMKYQVYPDIDEAQQKVLDENPLLDHYIQAIYFTFGGRDFDLAWSHTEALLEVMPESAQIQYLAGTIHFNKKAFEQAAMYYEASLAIDDTAPSVWYALANAYDAMEDYQQAYDCTLEVAQLLQYNNHAVDLYGVQIHNERMMNSLANKIEQGGN